MNWLLAAADRWLTTARARGVNGEPATWPPMPRPLPPPPTPPRKPKMMIPEPWRYHGPALETLSPDEVLATCRWALSVLESDAAKAHAARVHPATCGAYACATCGHSVAHHVVPRQWGKSGPCQVDCPCPAFTAGTCTCLGRCHVCLELYTGTDDGRCAPCRGRGWTTHREYLDAHVDWTQTHRHTHQDA